MKTYTSIPSLFIVGMLTLSFSEGNLLLEEGITDATNIDLHKFGLLQPSMCIYTIKGWLLAATCHDVNSYNLTFFLERGYDSSPEISQMFVTDLWSELSADYSTNFVFVFDYEGQPGKIELQLS